METKQSERREHFELRLIYGRACELTAPFYYSPSGYGGHLKLYARQTLRDAYPYLTQQDLAILLAVVERVHRSKRNL